MKAYIGKILFNLYQRHLERSFEMPFETEEDKKNHEEYYTFGLGSYKFNIIFDNLMKSVLQRDYDNCRNVDEASYTRNFYMYSDLYKRIFDETKGSFVSRIRLLLD